MTEAAAYVAPLGFDIDTSALLTGQKASEQFTQTLDKLANSADRLSNALDK